MADFTPHDFLFKVVLVGDSGVGKSNILGRYTKDEFLDNTPTTIGVEFTTKTTTYDNKSLAIQLWDTAGQERFNSIAKSYYRGAVGAFVIFDICNHSSFEHVERWLQQLKQHSHPNIVLCLLGNKADLKDSREVTTEEAEVFAKQHSLAFFEVSAKDATNINKAFDKMIVDIYNSVKKPQENKENNTSGNSNKSTQDPSQDPAPSPLLSSAKNTNSIKLNDPKPAETPGASEGCNC